MDDERRRAMPGARAGTRLHAHETTQSERIEGLLRRLSDEVLAAVQRCGEELRVETCRPPPRRSRHVVAPDDRAPVDEVTLARARAVLARHKRPLR
jgi:hypothetical protein